VKAEGRDETLVGRRRRIGVWHIVVFDRLEDVLVVGVVEQELEVLSLLQGHDNGQARRNPTSVRRARRAKTDRLDAEGMLRVLAAWLNGDRQICSMVHVPSPEEEDAKRPHREREHLVQERLRIENRIEALLFTQGIRGRPSLRSWERDIAELRTGDGRKLPPLLRAEVERLRRRLVLTLDLIREMETERDEALTATHAEATTQKITALQRIRGIGPNFAAVLVCEVLYRSFANRRQLASYVGIAPMPYQSGGVDRDRSWSKVDPALASARQGAAGSTD